MAGGPPSSLSVHRVLSLLGTGSLAIEGRVPWSSNATLLARISDGQDTAFAIYKPQRGECPLWDFAAGTLCRRETAAFAVSNALEWDLVPPTVLREGPLGLGAVQLFIPHDPDEHYLTMSEPDPEVIARIAAFDVIVNNADRKSGHVLRDSAGKLWIIDHGVTFHAEPKLRTVIWDFAGRRIPPDILAALQGLGERLASASSPVAAELAALLSSDEIAALAGRVRDLVSQGHYPVADPDRRGFPWPPV